MRICRETMPGTTDCVHCVRTWFPSKRDENNATAALIVAAVNERDRLRDIVRRLADVTHSLLGNYEYRFRDDQNSMEWVKNVRELTREARAALGEDAK